MKQGFIRKMAGSLMALALVAGLTACGDDSAPAPTATTYKVVKNVVSGAKVFDANGNQVGTTDANGNFSTTASGPFTTTGGTYQTINADGTAGATLPAPPMKAPAGFKQITPVSTLFANASAADQIALAAKLGLTDVKTADFSVKTTANATAFLINEAIGAALQTASTSNMTAAQLTALTNDLIKAVSTMTGTVTATSLSAAISATIAADTTLPADVKTNVTAAATTAATGAEKKSVTTGSTGGTGGTGSNF